MRIQETGFLDILIVPDGHCLVRLLRPEALDKEHGQGRVGRRRPNVVTAKNDRY